MRIELTTMATKAATQNLSGLARAMVQQGLLSEYDAETLSGQAQTANIGFVEQMVLSKRMNSAQVAVFASRAFGAPLFDLNGFDLDQINKDFVDARMVATRRILPLQKRGNRLFVAVSDPANMQALDEVRFKTNLVIDPVVVEDDKLGNAIAKVVETLGQTLKDLAGVDDLEVDLTEAATTPQSDDDDATPTSTTRRSSDTSRKFSSTPSRPAFPTSTSSPTKSSTGSATGSTASSRKSPSRRW